jgi:DNA-binding response OmpR family regulator
MLVQDVEILLLETQPEETAFILRQLQLHNFANTIHIAKNEAEARDFLFANNGIGRWSKIDNAKVVILEYGNPATGSLLLSNDLKTGAHQHCIKILLMAVSEEDVDKALESGYYLDSYVIRPLDFNRFAEAMRDLGLFWVLASSAPIIGHPATEGVRFSSN